MNRKTSKTLFSLLAAACVGWMISSPTQAVAAPQSEIRITLEASSLTAEPGSGDPAGLIDEQPTNRGAPVGEPEVAWKFGRQVSDPPPISAYIDLGSERNLSKFWFYDTNGVGAFELSVGKPGDWEVIKPLKTDRYKKWRPVQLDVTTRYLRVTITEKTANFSEIVLFEYTPEAHKALLARQAAEKEAAKVREAALEKAREEAKNRVQIDIGKPFGKLYVVDEIDCAADVPTHMFSDYPEGASKIENLLGQQYRVLEPVAKQSSYISYRIGTYKLLEPGMSYVLQVVYPEDAPRSMVVVNGGSETIRGFHTGPTVGDALHTLYVSSLPESINTPLTGKQEAWTSMFNLHDRFPGVENLRGAKERVLSAEDGFTVTIAQFSDRNCPLSKGIAVSKIRLLAVPDGSMYDLAINEPEGLPKRRIFWREEMSDGVVASEKASERGVDNYIDWWAYKRNHMKFVGINTYAKDLLEFGANQHWDSSEYGGNDWVYSNKFHKGDWAKIVKIMGDADLDVLPYFEYTGSKGINGLGNEKRTLPLTRNDSYTHISWVQSHGVDLTDPDAYDDFKKMLDLTVIRYQDTANFAGAWLRTRGGMPISFTDATRERFAKEANQGTMVTRKEMIDDSSLLQRYYDWWFLKRRDFFTAMRDHLRENGIDDATILYTAETKEGGTEFKAREVYLPTDQPELWAEIAERPEHKLKNSKVFTPIPPSGVVEKGLYRNALTAWPGTWGGWEWHHNSPPSDPQNYQNEEGLMLSHPFNRVYTVKDPATFETFRTGSGLAMMRHYLLNEHMIQNDTDQHILGYFVADMEKAGPFCMQSEAIAMANGDPTWIGYLLGATNARGFPYYTRRFNQAFLSLPALPSKVVPGAASGDGVVVRQIDAGSKGQYFSIVHLNDTNTDNVKITLPAKGTMTDAATGEALNAPGGVLNLSFYPYELRTIHIK